MIFWNFEIGKLLQSRRPRRMVKRFSALRRFPNFPISQFRNFPIPLSCETKFLEWNTKRLLQLRAYQDFMN
jgi:hypothetical protein